MKKICSNNTLTLCIVILIAILIIIGSVVAYYKKGYNEGYKDGYNKCFKELKDKYSSPIENIIIDTCYIRKDSLIYKTKYLVTIQYDTITKVRFLDDSTTVDLFYKLVAE